MNQTILREFYLEEAEEIGGNSNQGNDNDAYNYQVVPFTNSHMVTSQDACQSIDDIMYDTDDLRQALLLLIFKKQFTENDKPVTKLDCNKLKLMYGDNQDDQQIIQRRQFTAILQNQKDGPQVYNPEDEVYQEFKNKKLTLEGKVVNKKHLKLFKVIFDSKNDKISRV